MYHRKYPEKRHWMSTFQHGRPAGTTVLAVAGCVLAAILCRHISFSDPFIDAVLDILRPLFYAGLYRAWGISFRRRIIHKPTLHHLTGIAALMVFWIFIRSCKYMMPDEMAAALRMGWYMYYIPMLLIPAMGRKIIWIPFAAFGICLLYGILCYLRPYFWKVLFGDMTAAFCLLFAMVVESCIWCGLIP